MEYGLQTSAILYDKNLQQVDIIYRVKRKVKIELTLYFNEKNLNCGKKGPTSPTKIIFPIYNLHIRHGKKREKILTHADV